MLWCLQMDDKNLPDEIIRLKAEIARLKEQEKRNQAEISSLKNREQQERSLFEITPVSLWEEDFSQVKAALEAISADIPGDLEAYLMRHPEVLKDMANLIRVVDVNPATLELLGCRDLEDIHRWKDQCFAYASEGFFARELYAFYSGKTIFSFESPYRTLDGREGIGITYVTIAPGSEETWKKVYVSFLDITEKAQVEKVLQEQQAAFHALVDDLPGVVYRCELNYPWHMAFISEEILALSGYPARSFLKGEIAYGELIHPQDREMVAEKVVQAVQGHEPFEMEYRLQHASGETRRVYEKGRAFYGHDGQARWLDGVFLDISARRKTEDALLQSEQRFRNLFEGSPVAMSEEDFSAVKRHLETAMEGFDGSFSDYLDEHPETVKICASLVRFVRLNAAARALLQISDVDKITDGLNTIIADKNFTSFKRQLVLFWQGETTVEHEVNFRDAMGKYHRRLIHMNIPPGYEESWGMVIVSQVDITERHRIEQTLRRNEQRLQALLDLNRMKNTGEKELYDFTLEKGVEITSSQVGFLMFLDESEKKGIMHAWSGSAMAQCEIQEKPYHFNIPDAGIWAEAVRQRKVLVINDYSADLPGALGIPEGHVPLHRLLCAPIFDAGRVVCIGAVGNKPEPYDDQDTRELTLLYEGMWQLITWQRAEQALISSKKLAELGTLAAGVAHEINSPLQVITGQSERMIQRIKSGTSDPERLLQNLEMINTSAWRVAKIVRSLLAYARPTLEKFEEHDLNEIVRDTLLITEHQYRSWSNVEIVSLLPESLPAIYCDRNAMIQLLINLLSNARDAMPHGGKILIQTAYELARDRFILQVSDTGAGIPQSIRDRIFDPFVTTKPIGKGTGLGLSIVLGIVRSHGGEIEVDSEEGQGTVMTLFLPRMFEAQSTAEA